MKPAPLCILVVAQVVALAGCHRHLRKVERLTPPAAAARGAQAEQDWGAPTLILAPTAPKRPRRAFFGRMLDLGVSTGRRVASYAKTTYDMALGGAKDPEGCDKEGDEPRLAAPGVPSADIAPLEGYIDDERLMDRTVWLSRQLEAPAPAAVAAPPMMVPQCQPPQAGRAKKRGRAARKAPACVPAVADATFPAITAW